MQSVENNVNSISEDGSLSGWDLKAAGVVADEGLDGAG